MKDREKELGLTYLRGVLEKTGLNATELAREVNVASTTLTRPLNNPHHKHGVSLRTLLKIQAKTGIQMPSGLLGHKQERASSPYPQGAPIMDLPVWGQARGANGEGFVVNTDLASSFVERPWFLLGKRDSYALYTYEDSMSPVYEHGHLLYIDPSRPISPGDDVVIELVDGQSFVKRLVRRTAQQIICEQFNPPKERRFAVKDVAKMHLIVASLRVRT